MRVNDPQEQFGDPIIYANGNQVGRSIAGIAFYHDFPPGDYAFTVQSYGAPTSYKDRVQSTFFVRTLPPALDQAYLHMLLDKGPPRAL